MAEPSARPAAASLLSRADGQAEDRAGRAGDGQDRLAVGRVPDPDRLVVAPGDDLGPVGRHGDGPDGVGVAGERAEDVAVVEVEDLDGLVGRRRVDLGAVRVGGHREDRPLVPGEDPHGGRLPDPERAVGTRRDDRLVVGQRCRRRDRRMMSGELLELAAGGGVPEPDRLVGRAGRRELAVGGERRRTGPGPRGRRTSPASLPSPTVQIRASLSAEPVTSFVPSRLSFTARTASPWPAKSRIALRLVDVPELAPSCRPSPRRAGCRPWASRPGRGSSR